MARTNRIWKGLLMAGSVALGVGLLVLLIAAMNTKSAKPCADVEIRFTPEANARYTGKDLVLKLMHSKGLAGIKGQPVKGIDLKTMEEKLEQHPWIRNAELYFDNQRKLQVRVEEEMPIARVFTAEGSSFYIDSSLRRLPLNDRYTPRLPVFTGFPTDRKQWKGKDSVLMAGVKTMALYLHTDSFWLAQVEQVDINERREFELWPKVGEHVVVFGDAGQAADKFHRLMLFYQQVLANRGWNAYQRIDLRFDGQIVAVPDKQPYRKTDTALYRQWFRQWQAQQAQPASQQVATSNALKLEAPDHASPTPTRQPTKTNQASTPNPVPGKPNQTGKPGALPAEKTGPKAVMPPSAKTS